MEVYRIFGHEITEKQAMLLSTKEDLINYCRELTGLKTENVGPSVVPIPNVVRNEMVWLLDRISNYDVT